MKISLPFMDQLQGISEWEQAKGFVRQVFEDLVAQIKAGWNANHNADGTHSAVVADSVKSAAGYYEHGRVLKLGEWEEVGISNADVSSDTGTFSIGTNLVNLSVFRYTKIGKTIFLNVRFFSPTTSITGTPEYLRIKLPASLGEMIRLSSSFLDDDRVFCGVAVTTQGLAFCFVGIKGDGTYLELEPAPTGLWAAAAGDFTICGQLFYEAANY